MKRVSGTFRKEKRGTKLNKIGYWKEKYLVKVDEIKMMRRMYSEVVKDNVRLREKLRKLGGYAKE